ncbi:MAG: sugar ABC transporter permease [Clostridia bacterium]|nr:sugar ABC transporter permease [Clostridia bacterium]
MDNNVNINNSTLEIPAKRRGLFGRKPSLERRKARAGYVFVLPFILGIVLIYLPILIDTVWFSLNDFKWVSTLEEGLVFKLTFEGFSYYSKAFETPEFTEALLAGIQQLIFEVPAIIVFSLFIAVVLNQKMLGRAAFRAIFFVPVIIATGIMETINMQDLMSSSAGSGINDGTQGGANEIISVLDVQALFSNMKVGGELVEYVVSLVNQIYSIINYSGVQMLIFLAGLQSISPSIYEASQIEGATGWETFWKITFPMISPMILVNAVYTIIDSFTRTNNPAMVYIDGFGGAPSQSIAMSWIYFLLVIVIIGVVAAIASSMVFYQRRD